MLVPADVAASLGLPWFLLLQLLFPHIFDITKNNFLVGIVKLEVRVRAAEDLLWFDCLALLDHDSWVRHTASVVGAHHACAFAVLLTVVDLNHRERIVGGLLRDPVGSERPLERGRTFSHRL
jgi:hypothetical protein